MAITLQLTDGTQTVDFNDGTSLSLGDVFQVNVGSGTVTELIIAGWEISSTDSKAAKLRDIQQLIRKGVRHYRERKINDAVWLKFQPEGASSAQYAKVQGGSVQEVRSDTVGGRDGGTLMVEVLREGYWRSVAPDGTAGTEVVAATTIYNKSDTDGDNWLTVSARDIDAPGLLQFDIDAAQGYQSVLIAQKRGSTTLLNKFNPWFNPTDNSSSTSTSADTAAPDDLKISFTSTSFVTWSISAADFPGYAGRYLVYGWIKQVSGAGSATAAFSMTSPATQENDAVDVSETIGKLYLGQLNFPGAVMYNPFYDSAQAATIKLDITISSTATVDIYGLWLVPIDYPPFEVTDSNDFNSLYTQWIDSVTQQVYEIDGSGDWQGSGALTTQGIYPQLDPNIQTRFFFYFGDGDDHEFNDSYEVTIDCVDRFETVRGAA